MSPEDLSQYMENMPVLTKSCYLQGRNSTLTLPDHCCWYGVSCCVPPDTCGNNPYCNCSFGTVTGLSMNYNQVRSTHLLLVKELPTRDRSIQ